MCTVAVLIGALAGVQGAQVVTEAAHEGVSPLAEAEIPPLYLTLYMAAARRYGIDWAILAGIGRVECDHGRDPDPSCTKEGVVNAAGAGGPMQFIAATWARYGVDGDGDGRIDRWDPADAIYSAANYLRASGAPGDVGRALLSYNHAAWYVAEVEHWAALYRAPELVREPVQIETAADDGADVSLAERTTTPVRFIAGDRALLSPTDGHLAMVPAGAPAVVQAMVVAGNELQGLALRPRRAPGPARGLRRGLLEHGQLRALPGGDTPDRGNHQGEPPRPGLRALGSLRPGEVGDDLRGGRPDAARLHGHRRPQARHQPRRHRHRTQPLPGWPALADPRSHTRRGRTGR